MSKIIGSCFIPNERDLQFMVGKVGMRLTEDGFSYLPT